MTMDLDFNTEGGEGLVVSWEYTGLVLALFSEFIVGIVVCDFEAEQKLKREADSF